MTDQHRDGGPPLPTSGAPRFNFIGRFVQCPATMHLKVGIDR